MHGFIYEPAASCMWLLLCSHGLKNTPTLCLSLTCCCQSSNAPQIRPAGPSPALEVFTSGRRNPTTPALNFISKPQIETETTFFHGETRKFTQISPDSSDSSPLVRSGAPGWFGVRNKAARRSLSGLRDVHVGRGSDERSSLSAGKGRGSRTTV